MKITVWGCRGTLPTPGHHTLKYGGNTTCLEIRNKEGFPTIIDAGSGLRLLGKKLMQSDDSHELCLILTHSHWDHLMGFPFFIPAYFSKYKINVCGIQSARNYMAQSLARQLEAPYFPVNFDQLKAKFNFDCKGPGCERCVHLKVEAINLSHPNGGYGFKFSEGNSRFVFLTDNELGYQHPGGLITRDYIEFSRDADLLFHDAQYTDEDIVKTKTWGHSTYNEALDLAIEANVKKLGLFHHDPDRTDAEIDKIVEELQKKAATRSSRLEVFAVYEGMQIELE
jgi:phosphoribosyl 1,2-cyclic phosphodiesterase